MGGHGGLNILPQKRWNVYNRDNRLKVAQDEAKAKEAEDKERERAENAEREYRHQLLLQRAGREHDAPAAGPSAAAEPVAQIEGAGLSSGTDQQQPQQQQLEQLEHINFWREDELKAAAQHPEVEAAKKEEARKRGKADFYTTDPKFDERFQLGYNMKGDAPWYAQRGAAQQSIEADPLFAAGAVAVTGGPGPKTLQGSQPAAALPAAPPSGPEHPTKRSAWASSSSSSDDSSSSSSSSISSDSSTSSSSSSSSGSEGSSRKHKRGRSSKSRSRKGITSSKRRRRRSSSSSSPDRKRRRRSKSKSKSREKHGVKRSRHGSKKSRKSDRQRAVVLAGSGLGVAAQGGGTGMSALEQLRAERLAREAAERARERAVLMGALDPGAAGREPQGYNSGFGFAAALHKPRRH